MLRSLPREGICTLLGLRASPVAQLVENPPAMWVQALGWKDPLEKGKATHSGILAWRIPWTVFHGLYSPWGCKESDTTERLSLSLSGCRRASQVALV